MGATTTGNHVGPIIFADQTARQQLKTHGVVVTFRKSARTTGDTWWRKSRLGTKEGNVLVTEIAQINPEDETQLRPHQRLSGFETVHEWQQAIQALNGTLPDFGHLYRVELID